MNCDEHIISREDAKRLVEISTMEAKIQLCNWFLQMLGTGMTTGMIRRIVYNKIVELEGKGEKA